MSYEMRMALAKDVIVLLDTQEISTRMGTYFYAPSTGLRDGGFFATLIKRPKEEDIPLSNCEVCAKGAFFVAYLRRNDRRSELRNMFSRIKTNMVYDTSCPADSIATGRTINEVLGDTFDAKQLQMIEAAFEGGEQPDECINLLTSEEINTCYMFCKSDLDSRNTLRAICENILRNDGTFRPENK